MTSVNFQIVEGATGLRFVLQSSWSARMTSVYHAAGCTELELNSGKGWMDSDLSFVADLANLRGLIVRTPFVKNCTPIQDLENLEILELESNGKGALDFSKFNRLVECGFNWRAGGESIFACAGLKRLYINRLPVHDLGAAAELGRLEEIVLLSPALQTLNGISQLQELRYLRLGLATKLTDVADMRRCKGLNRVEMSQCRKVHDFSSLGEVHDLKRIELIDCGKISSLRWISKLESLKELFFYGDTNIEDGDLSPLLKLTSLKKVAFQARRHYSHRPENFDHPTRGTAA